MVFFYFYVYLILLYHFNKPNHYLKNMTKQFYKDAFGWGFVLWLIDYVLGIILFMAVPVDLIGWIVTPHRDSNRAVGASQKSERRNAAILSALGDYLDRNRDSIRLYFQCQNVQSR